MTVHDYILPPTALRLWVCGVGVALPAWLGAQPAFGQTTVSPESSGATVTHQDERSTTTATADESGLSARREVDCSKDPLNDVCQETTTSSADARGLGFSHTRTSVQRVKTPGKGFAQLYFEAGALIGDGSGITMLGGTGAIGVQGALGGQLPGAEGGGWSGFGFRLNGSGGFISIETSVDVPDGFGGTSSSSSSTESAQYGASGVAGYQFLTYGELDPTTLKQSGFGLFLGFSGGLFGTGETDPSFSYGPSIVLSRPSYNAGTATMSSLFLSGIVLPLPDFLIATVNVGFSFGLRGQDVDAKRGEACESHGDCAADLVCSAQVCAAPAQRRPASGTASGAAPATTVAPNSNLPPPSLPPLDF